jgi:hypothetical protein
MISVDPGMLVQMKTLTRLHFTVVVTSSCIIGICEFPVAIGCEVNRRSSDG